MAWTNEIGRLLMLVTAEVLSKDCVRTLGPFRGILLITVPFHLLRSSRSRTFLLMCYSRGETDARVVAVYGRQCFFRRSPLSADHSWCLFRPWSSIFILHLVSKDLGPAKPSYTVVLLRY